MHDSLDNLAYNEGTFELVQTLSFLHILKQILPVDVLSDQILMCFGLYFFFVLYDLRMVNYFHDLTLIPY